MKQNLQLEIAVRGLRDIIDPVGKIRREMDKRSVLNGGMAVMLADDPNHLRNLARETLRKMGRKV